MRSQIGLLTNKVELFLLTITNMDSNPEAAHSARIGLLLTQLQLDPQQATLSFDSALFLTALLDYQRRS